MSSRQIFAGLILLFPLSVATIFACAVSLMGPRSAQAPAGPQPPSQKPIVVVELFTAEGCSDCLPADELLATMARVPLDDVSIIPLGFHVTYWNQLGWRDRFSAENYTDRQKQYGDQFHLSDIFTPQAVIDGQYQAALNDTQKVVALIRRPQPSPSRSRSTFPSTATPWPSQPSQRTQVRAGFCWPLQKMT